MLVEKLIIRGGGEIDVSEYVNFFEDDGFGGGSSPNSPGSVSRAVEESDSHPRRTLTFSKKRQSYGTKDPEGLIVMARDVVAIKPMDPKLETLLLR